MFCNSQTIPIVLSLLASFVLPMAANCQTLGETQAIPFQVQSIESEKSALKVNFPAPGVAPVRVISPKSLTAPVPVPAAPQRTVTESLMVSRMAGQVHFKHVQNTKLDPARALVISTGKGNSWCEFKMRNLTGRVWSDSELVVFPDTSVCYLKKGALIVRAHETNGSKYSVISGPYVCRVQNTTLRVQRQDNEADFQVLDGEITVYNKSTGEVSQARQVSRPVR